MIARIPGPWRFPLAVLAVVLVVVVTVGVDLAVTSPTKDDPTPTQPAAGSPTLPATESPTLSVSGSPSPSVSPTAVPGSLDAMLQMTPDRLSDGSLPLPFVASYANISAWMAANGVAVPTSLSDPNVSAFERELGALSLPTSLATRGMEPIWQETYGFDLAQVHQIVMAGQAPDSVFIMTGDFNATALQNAWVGSGYQAVKLEGMTIWSLWPEDVIDLSAPASRPALGSLNNIVLLPDGTLIAAAKISQLQSALKVRNGNASSLASNGDVKKLLADRVDTESLISAVIEKGDLLATLPPAVATPSPTEPDTLPAASSPEAVATMPEVKLTLIGLRRPATGAIPGTATPASPVATPASGPPDGAAFVMLFVFGNEGDARVATSIMRERLANDRSTVTDQRYDERLADATLKVPAAKSGSHLVILEARLVAGVADWLQLVETRDLGFAYWEQKP